MLEIVVRAQHDEFIAYAELCEERINRPDLKATAATIVAKVCRSGVIFALGHDQRQRCESLENLFSSLGAIEPLQDFLKDQSCRKDRSFVLKSVRKEVDARMSLILIAPQRK